METIIVKLKKSDFDIENQSCMNYENKFDCPLARASKRLFETDDAMVGSETVDPVVHVAGNRLSYDGSVWNQVTADRIAKELSSWKSFFKKFNHTVTLTVL